MMKLLLLALVYLAFHGQVSVAAAQQSDSIPHRAPRTAEKNASHISVNDTIRQALSYSPQLQQAQESRQQAEHEVRQAEAGYYPTIGIWGGAGASQSDDTTTRATNEQTKVVGTVNGGAAFSQSLWQGGYTSSLVRSRTATMEAQAHMITDSATLLVYNAVTCHVDVIRRRYLVQLAEQNVREHEQILRLLNTLFEQSIASSGEVDQVRGRLARAEATVITHKLGLQAALANYTRITGKPAPQSLQSVPLPPLMYGEMDKVRDDSVRHNARLLAEIAGIKSALGERDMTRSGFSPQISLDGGPGYADWGHKGVNYQWTWNAMLNMRWNVYNGGADMAAFNAASAKVRSLRKSLHAYMDLLDEEIKIAYSRAYELREQSRFYGKAKVASRASRDNFYAQFQAGTRRLLDVLDAESEYFFATVEECITDTDSVLGFYRLLALSGRLLPEMGISAAALHKKMDAGSSGGSVWNFKPSQLDTTEVVKGTTLHDSRTGR